MSLLKLLRDREITEVSDSFKPRTTSKCLSSSARIKISPLSFSSAELLSSSSSSTHGCVVLDAKVSDNRDSASDDTELCMRSVPLGTVTATAMIPGTLRAACVVDERHVVVAITKSATCHDSNLSLVRLSCRSSPSSSSDWMDMTTDVATTQTRPQHVFSSTNSSTSRPIMMSTSTSRHAPMTTTTSNEDSHDNNNIFNFTTTDNIVPTSNAQSISSNSTTNQFVNNSNLNTTQHQQQQQLCTGSLSRLHALCVHVDKIFISSSLGVTSIPIHHLNNNPPTSSTSTSISSSPHSLIYDTTTSKNAVLALDVDFPNTLCALCENGDISLFDTRANRNSITLARNGVPPFVDDSLAHIRTVHDTTMVYASGERGILRAWDKRMPLAGHVLEFEDWPAPKLDYDCARTCRMHGDAFDVQHHSIGMLAAVSDDGFVRVWDSHIGGKPLQTVPVVRTVEQDSNSGHDDDDDDDDDDEHNGVNTTEVLNRVGFYGFEDGGNKKGIWIKSNLNFYCVPLSSSSSSPTRC